MDAYDTLDNLENIGNVKEFVLEEEEESGDEDVRHKNLLTSLGIEETADESERSKKDQRSEATNDVSIYSINVGSKVKAHDLVKSLKETVNVNLIKKSLTKVEDSKNQLSALLPKITADKVERDAAYDAATEKVSRWDDIVKRNRATEHLSFPLKHENLSIHTVDDFVTRFKPKTPLEKEVYALLKGNKYEEHAEDGLTIAEEEALKSVSLQEARRRRAELQKHRALLSYHEAKNRRLGKIKSKRHLRIIRKQKEKKSATEFEELQQKDPETAAAMLKRAEKTRAEERAILRHRQGSKWTKNRALMAKYDEMTKVEIQEQRRLHNQLMEKNITKTESSDEDSDDEKEGPTSQSNTLVPPTASLPTIYLPRNNPWLRQAEKNVKSDENHNFPVKDEEKPTRMYTRSQTAILGLETVTKNKGRKDSEEESEESEEEELKDELVEIKKRKKMREEMQDGPGRNKVAEDQEKQSNSGFEETIFERIDVQEESIKNFKAALENLQKEKTRNSVKNKDEEKEQEEVGESEEDDKIDVSLTRRKTLQDIEQALEADEEISTLSELHKTAQRRIEKKKKTPKLQQIDPNKVFTLETKTVESVKPTIVENELQDDPDRMMIQEAFADDDVLFDFVSEKRKVVSDSKPKPQDLTLPGWGEWGGVGIKPSRRKRRKFFIKPNPPPPRKDQHLGPVIINEKRNAHIAKYQINQIPFPYTSDEQFERSIRQPIGQTWNTPSAFKKLTQPKVSTVMGAIIQPMDEEDAFDNVKPQQRKRVMQDDGRIGFDDVTDTSFAKKRFKRNKGNKKHKK